MSASKRLAKRSIIGTRVCGALKETGLYHPGVIIGSKNPDEFILTSVSSHTGITPNSKFVVRFDTGEVREFSEGELVGPGFGNVGSLKLKPKQRAFVTHNGREVCGTVVYHRPQIDEVLMNIQPQSPNEIPFDVTKKLDEVRLLESRKSARLQEQDFDFARLADVSDRKRNQQTASIDVPRNNNMSRKRRPSSGSLFQSLVTVNSGVGSGGDDVMDECAAAMVLMSLSCSPHSPHWDNGMISSSWSSSSSGASSMLSANFGTAAASIGATPGTGSSSSSSGASSELLSSSSHSSSHLNNFSPTPSSSDDGIESDVGGGDMSWGDCSEPRKKRTRLIFKCTWPGCTVTKEVCYDIEAHVRSIHLADQDVAEHEEEFYYTEVEVPDLSSPAPGSFAPSSASASLPPSFTLSAATIQQLQQQHTQHHLQNQQQQLNQVATLPIHQLHQLGHSVSNLSSSVNLSSMAFSPTLSHLDMVRPASEDPEYKLHQQVQQQQRKSPNNTQLNPKKRLSPKSSPVRRPRGDTKKCRKVYGMDRRDLWCTQCKWKKACTRFGD